MKALSIVELGLEDACSEEIKDILKIRDIQKGRGAVIFEAKMDPIFQFCYASQSVSRVLLLIAEFGVERKQEKTIKNLKASLKGADLAPHFKGASTFRVDCERHGEHDFSSMDIESSSGELIQKLARLKGASMKDPDRIVYVYIRDCVGYIGIDLAGRDLSKRHYKIFTHPSTIKGTLAYALLKEAGFTGKMTLLDPFCGSGTIPIEAALSTSKTSPNFYLKDFAFQKMPGSGSSLKKIDSLQKKVKKKIFGSDKELRNLKAATKNAKIAGIEKYITISKIDIEWLDTKFDEGSVDRIITNPPQESKNTNPKDLEKTYKEFFYQSLFVLKKTGTMTLLSMKTDLIRKAAESGGLSLIKEKSIYSGEQEYHILVYKKR